MYEDNFYHLNESFTTFKNNVKDFVNRIKNKNIDYNTQHKQKEDQFNQLYSITPNLNKKLCIIVKTIPNAVIVNSKTLSNILNTNVEDSELSEPLHWILRAEAPSGAKAHFTKALHKYILHFPDGKAACLFFEFDTNQINKCYCMVKKNNEYGYSLESIQQWNNINKNEYTKSLNEFSMSTYEHLANKIMDKSHNASVTANNYKTDLKKKLANHYNRKAARLFSVANNIENHMISNGHIFKKK